MGASRSRARVGVTSLREAEHGQLR
jgi:hypothetical protein